MTEDSFILSPDRLQFRCRLHDSYFCECVTDVNVANTCVAKDFSAFTATERERLIKEIIRQIRSHQVSRKEVVDYFKSNPVAITPEIVRELELAEKRQRLAATIPPFAGGKL